MRGDTRKNAEAYSYPPQTHPTCLPITIIIRHSRHAYHQERVGAAVIISILNFKIVIYYYICMMSVLSVKFTTRTTTCECF